MVSVAGIVLGLALLWAGAGLVLRPQAVHISGDLAFEIADAIRDAAPEIAVARSEGKAGTIVVTVTDWSKLAFVPGAAAGCGPRCSAESEDRIVRVIRVGPLGPRKYVFVNIREFLDPEVSAMFALSGAGRECLARGVMAEARGLRGASWPMACPGGPPPATLIRPGFR